MNWTQIDNMRKKHIRFGERLFRRMYSAARADLSQRLLRAEGIGELSSILEGVNIEGFLLDAFDKFYRTVGVDFAKQTYRRFKAASGMETKQEDIGTLTPLWDSLMAAYVLDKCGVKMLSVIKTYNKTWNRVLDKAVEQGLNEGWGVDRIAREILRQGTRAEKWQAMRIARTEVLSASNYGSLEGAKTTGIPMIKRWLPSSSADPRPDHQDMANQSVDFDQLFELPSGAVLEYPGDPIAPLDEIINCRCGISIEPKEDIIEQILEQ